MQLTLGNPAEVEDECFIFDVIMNCVNATNTKCNCFNNWIIKLSNQITGDVL